MQDLHIIRKTLDTIENQRGNSNPFWIICVKLKDIIWRISSFIINKFSRFKRTPDLKKFNAVENYFKISFCITSMDRLFHIKKTLLKNIKDNSSYPKIEFILLDYNSKDGLREWVSKNCKEYLESGVLIYHRTVVPTTFHMADAKNRAHKLATGDILCGLDADNFTNKDFAFFINFYFNKNKNCIATNTWENQHSRLSDFGGRICISKENFVKLNGYDTDFNGWGYEDLDFKHRAFEMGIKSISIHPFFLKCIQHSDSMRDKNMPISKVQSTRKNKELFLLKRERAKA